MPCVLLLGRKTIAARALDILVAHGLRVFGVVEDEDAAQPGRRPLSEHAAELGVRRLSLTELRVERPRVDHVLSFLYSRRVPGWLLGLAEVAALNFHPAPLPHYRGLGGYNVAILEGRTSWGVTAHVMTSEFDSGDIVAERSLPVLPDDTAESLEYRTRRALLELFEDVVRLIVTGGALHRVPQAEGRYIDRAEFERLRRVAPSDDPATVERKIRAFWFPPYEGAVIEIGGQDFTLVSQGILQRLAAREDRA